MQQLVRTSAPIINYVCLFVDVSHDNMYYTNKDQVFVRRVCVCVYNDIQYRH